MRRMLFVAIGLMLFCATAFVRAAETNLTPASVQRAAAVAVDTNALLARTTWHGLLFAAPTNSPADVAAILKQEKRQKTPGFLLRTESPVLFARMLDLSHAHNGSSVVLEGRMQTNCTTILITDLRELTKERKAERK